MTDRPPADRHRDVLRGYREWLEEKRRSGGRSAELHEELRRTRLELGEPD